MLRSTTHTYCFLLLLVMLALGTGSEVRAQQRSVTPLQLSPDDRSRELNGAQTNFFFAPEGSEDYQDAGFFGQRLRPYLKGNSLALEHLNDYRRQKWLFLGERLVFVGAVGVYAQQVLAGNQQQYTSPVQIGAMGVGAASLLANVLISRNTNMHFRQAIDAHNQDVPLAQVSNWQRLRPTNVGVAAWAGKPQLVLSWSWQ